PGLWQSHLRLTSRRPTTLFAISASNQCASFHSPCRWVPCDTPQPRNDRPASQRKSSGNGLRLQQRDGTTAGQRSTTPSDSECQRCALHPAGRLIQPSGSFCVLIGSLCSPYVTA